MMMTPTELLIGCALLGSVIGSFLNVVIHRLPIMLEREWAIQCADLRNEPRPEFDLLSLSKPRSRCPKCSHAITAAENIPVLSYLFLRGHCKGCKAPISLRYPMVELLTAVMFALASWKLGLGWPLLGALGFISAAIALSLIDFDTQLLPDDITLPLIWAGLLFNLSGTFATLRSAVIGAILGYLALWCVFWLFKLATGKEGMGYGDFKLLAAIGAWLGWQMLPLVILLSSFVGAVVGIIMIVVAKRGRDVPIPFGPYLATAGVIALFWGHELTVLYAGNAVFS